MDTPLTSPGTDTKPDSLPDFRDPSRAKLLYRQIHEAVRPGQRYRFMEFCGGHTHTLFRHGLTDSLPSAIELLHGPGCPVCVLPMARMDMAIRLAKRPEVILCTYGDMLRVPGSQRQNLLQLKAEGARIEVLYSPHDCLALAKAHPECQIVFFAVGFETTAPTTALLVTEAERQGLRNLTVFCNHVLTPPAIRGILAPTDDSPAPQLEGLIGPGHVSVITGMTPYHALSTEFQINIEVCGFEPLDLLQGILTLVQRTNAGSVEAHNQYTRAVTASGNLKAQALLRQVFVVRDAFEWRGLGFMPHSALALAPGYARFDAEHRFALQEAPAQDNRACACPSVLRGQTRPEACPLWDNPCTPDNPIGACMVSSEGACAAHYRYRRHQRIPTSA